MVNYKSKYLKYKLKLEKLNKEQNLYKGGWIKFNIDRSTKEQVTIDKRSFGELDENENKILAEVSELIQKEDKKFNISENELFLIKIVELVKVYNKIKSEINIKDTFEEYLKIKDKNKAFILMSYLRGKKAVDETKLGYFEEALKNQPIKTSE